MMLKNAERRLILKIIKERGEKEVHGCVEVGMEK
jgi:hypothetical protein